MVLNEQKIIDDICILTNQGLSLMSIRALKLTSG